MTSLQKDLPNLAVLTDAQVVKVLSDGNNVIGVGDYHGKQGTGSSFCAVRAVLLALIDRSTPSADTFFSFCSQRSYRMRWSH